VAEERTEIAKLTIFVADLKEATPNLIRGARNLNPKLRVAFCRVYEQSDKVAKKAGRRKCDASDLGATAGEIGQS
jgi:hypothetical protein